MSATLAGLFRYVVLLFSLPVLAMLGFPLFEHAWSNLRRGVLSTDWLLASGVGASFAVSFLSVIRGEGPIYFEVGCVILVMTALGRWLEATGRVQAGAALDSSGEAPAGPGPANRGRAGALVPRSRSGSAIRSASWPASAFPADGRVVRNAGLVDEQVLTGESHRSSRSRATGFSGGTLNLDGDFTIRVTEAGGTATLARVVEMVRRARESKGRYQRLADRAATVFAPTVPAIALVAFGIHWAHRLAGAWPHGRPGGRADRLPVRPGPRRAIGRLEARSEMPPDSASSSAAARPSSGSRTSRRSGSIRPGPSRRAQPPSPISSARMPRTSQPSWHAPQPSHRHLPMRSRERSSISRRRPAGAESADGPGVSEIRIVPGMGAVGRSEGSTSPIVLGSRRFLERRGLSLGPAISAAIEDAEGQGLPFSLVGWDDRARGLFVFEERWRPGAREVIRSLAEAGLDVAVLTGDHASRGRAIARQLGVVVEAELLPGDKSAAIARAATVRPGLHDRRRHQRRPGPGGQRHRDRAGLWDGCVARCRRRLPDGRRSGPHPLEHRTGPSHAPGDPW